MTKEINNCQNCKKDFVIEPDDFVFYEKIKVPPPTFCSDCRLQRRLTWRNERTLYKRKCNAQGHDEMLISMYSPDVEIPVYDQHYWHGDEWEALSYGREYDFSVPFFKQWRDLFFSVPTPNVLNINNFNSDYCNFVFDSKNCYLNFASDMNEDTAYLYHSIENRNCFDMLGSRKNENSYELIDCERCYNSEHLSLCDECIDSKYCYDCRNCQNCLGCVGLRNAKYYIFNKQYTPEDYIKEVEKLSKKEKQKNIEKKFFDVLLQYPRRFSNSRQAVNSIGDYLNNVKNCKDCFDVEGPAEDSRFVTYGVTGIKNVYDSFAGGVHFENSYEVINTGLHASSILFSGTVWESYNINHCYFLKNCKNCFGCVGLKNKQYCILNKQYTKDEYEKLVPKIIKHMDEMQYVDKKGRIYAYGEFFPMELSPFAYNESTAQQYFQLNKKETLDCGYGWKEKEERNYKIEIENKDLPEIKNVDESIIGKVIGCEYVNGNDKCTEAFKITVEEFKFYKKMNLSLPKLCPNCRHYQRLSKRNPMKLWHRTCMCNQENHFHGREKCEVEFETSYAPEKAEIVFCEKCYQQEVY